MEAEILPIDRILKAFEELETQKSLISNCALQWQSLSDHYASIEKTLAERSQSIDLKIESLESETKQALDSLDQRLASLPQRESSAAALIEERRDSVVVEIEDPESRPPRNLNGILRWYCRRMDAAGLWRFMVARRKELEILRRELSEAVLDTVDPPRLVLDVIEYFMSDPSAAAAAAAACGGEKFWAVGALVKALFDLVGKKAAEVSGSIRDRAAVVAESWRAKHVGKKGGEHAEEDGKGEVDKVGMDGAEARIFLRMVIAFGLRSRFDEDFLLKLVVENAARKDMPKHAARLGFGEKVEEVIDLVKSGKEIDAIYLAHEYGLLDKFSPIPLLKSHLQNSRKNANAMAKRSQSASFMEESNKLELNCIKSIIKCVETFNLEPQFTLEILKKRVVELESGTVERKRKQESKRSQAKRSRLGSSNSSFRSARPFRSSRASYPSYPPNLPMAAAQIPPARQPYNYAAQVGFDVHPPASYGAAAHRSPSLPQYYAPEDISGARNAMPYGGPPVNYGSYDYSGAQQ